MTRRDFARVRDVAQAGGVMVIFLVSILVPLVTLVGAAVTSMIGRNSKLLAEIHGEKAMQAAEAGIDDTMYRAAAGTLDMSAPFTRVLGPSISYRVDMVNLYKDGKDNDGDSQVDDVDERIMMLTVTGYHRSARKRLRGFMTLSAQPMSVNSAVGWLRQSISTIQLDGDASSFISGNDKNLDGTNGPGVSLPGMAIMPPATTALLTGGSGLDLASEKAKVTGAGATPSVAVLPNTFDVNKIVDAVKNAPDVINLDSSYDGINQGNASTGSYKKLYRNGDLQISKTSYIAGVVVVTGTVQIADDCTIDGVLVVLGNVNLTKTVKIRGALIMGGDQLYMSDQTKVQYSSTATQGALQTIVDDSKLKPTGTVLSWQQVPLD